MFSNKRRAVDPFVFLCLLIPFFGISQKATLKRLDKYFQTNLTAWNIPGMSVAIVKDDSLVFAKGYGVRDIDTKEAVDENTLFAIASNSKSFTSAAIAILVDEGKLKWDDKVIDYLSYFKLYDPYVTHSMTIRDLLSHRSGLKTFSGDLIWYGSSHDREEVIRRAGFLKPRYSFRTEFGYSNIMYLAVRRHCVRGRPFCGSPSRRAHPTPVTACTYSYTQTHAVPTWVKTWVRRGGGGRHSTTA